MLVLVILVMNVSITVGILAASKVLKWLLILWGHHRLFNDKISWKRYSSVESRLMKLERKISELECRINDDYNVLKPD